MPLPLSKTLNCRRTSTFFYKKPPIYYSGYTAMQYRASTITTKVPQKMAATTPVAVGTRGTVGSLLRKEIEYFTKFELERSGSSRNHQGQMASMASSSGHSRPSFWSLTMSWKRKRRRGNSKFLPSICSVVEVADANQLNGVPGFNYRILKDEMEDKQL